MDSFFGIGVFELVFILIFALIFLGPERLPGALREVIGVLRKVRDISSEITEQFSDEFGDLQDLQELDPRRQIQKALYEPKKKATGNKKEPVAKKNMVQKGNAQAKETDPAPATPANPPAARTTGDETVSTAAGPPASEVPAERDADAPPAPAGDADSVEQPEASAPSALEENSIAPPRSIARHPQNGVASAGATPDVPAPAPDPKQRVAEEEPR